MRGTEHLYREGVLILLGGEPEAYFPNPTGGLDTTGDLDNLDEKNGFAISSKALEAVRAAGWYFSGCFAVPGESRG